MFFNNDVIICDFNFNSCFDFFLNCLLLKWVVVIFFKGVVFIFVFEFCILVIMFCRCILGIIILKKFWILFGVFVVIIIFCKFLNLIVIFLLRYCGLFFKNFIRYCKSLIFVIIVWLRVLSVFFWLSFSIVDEKNVLEVVENVKKIIRV